MTQEQSKKIFLPFEQVGDHLHKSEGTGLGLAISSQIVELMGSEIQFESIYGQGSKFWFDLDLPIVDNGKSLISSNIFKHIVGYEGEQKTILVIDKIDDDRSFIADLLSPIGFKLIEVNCIEQGLDKTKLLQADLIIIDLSLLTIDELNMIKNPQATGGFPVIIASSAMFNFTPQEGQEAGFDVLLQKPVKIAELFEILQHYLSIKWTYLDSYNSSVNPLYYAEEIIFPPPTELVTLYQAAKAGYVVGIQEEVARIVQLDKKYTHFTDKVSELIAEFEDEAIVAMIQPYISC